MALGVFFIFLSFYLSVASLIDTNASRLSVRKLTNTNTSITPAELLQLGYRQGLHLTNTPLVANYYHIVRPRLKDSLELEVTFG